MIALMGVLDFIQSSQYFLTIFIETQHICVKIVLLLYAPNLKLNVKNICSYYAQLEEDIYDSQL